MSTYLPYSAKCALRELGVEESVIDELQRSDDPVAVALADAFTRLDKFDVTVKELRSGLRTVAREWIDPKG